MSTAGAIAQRNADFQRTTELINRFTLSSVQFLNRFAAMCDEKLYNANRALQRLEVQVKLLEVKLDSAEDADGARPAASSGKAPSAGSGIAAAPSVPAITAGPPAPVAAGKAPGPPPPPGARVPLAITAGKNAPPPMQGFGGRGASGVPPPPSRGVGGSSGGPPLPPDYTPPPPPMGAPGGAPHAPVLPMGSMPPPGFMPPPPPMPLGASRGNTMRNHAVLQGYFKMLDAGVPRSAVEARMQGDGHNPQWLSTPDAPAPAGLAAPKPTLYDSD